MMKKKLAILGKGALLHDIGDHKFYDGDHTVGPRMVTDWLTQNNVEANVITKVVAIVKEISYKGAEVETPMSSLEGQIVQDADRLDAIGAIGIARTFHYGGYKNRKLYDPDIQPNINQTKEEYKDNTAPTINHFYEKLLLLKGRMNTETGKRIAERRHIFMETFLDEFYKDWEGE